MKKFISTVRGKIVVFGGGALLLAAIGVILFFVLRQQDYRVVKVYNVEGSATITRDGLGTVTPYENMLLQNEDRGNTFEDGYLYLNLDDDKYALAEPDTSFALEATGTSSNSRTRFNLEKGALVFHVTKQLSRKSTFEVTTPNSTMAIRGTSFRVLLLYDESGVSHTYLEVFEGVVEIRLRYPDGSISEEAVLVEKGQMVSVWGNDETSDFDRMFEEIDYYELEIPTLVFLKLGINELDGYAVTIPEVDEIIERKQSYYNVFFMANGNVFGTQSVLYGNLASVPTLMPTQNGYWAYDFGEPIREETTIQWIEE